MPWRISRITRRRTRDRRCLLQRIIITSAAVHDVPLPDILYEKAARKAGCSILFRHVLNFGIFAEISENIVDKGKRQKSGIRKGNGIDNIRI